MVNKFFLLLSFFVWSSLVSTSSYGDNHAPSTEHLLPQHPDRVVSPTTLVDWSCQIIQCAGLGVREIIEPTDSEQVLAENEGTNNLESDTVKEADTEIINSFCSLNPEICKYKKPSFKKKDFNEKGMAQKLDIACLLFPEQCENKADMEGALEDKPDGSQADILGSICDWYRRKDPFNCPTWCKDAEDS